jgi:hypothetical protein
MGSLDGQDLLLDIDPTHRAAREIAADGAGIAVGLQNLTKRLHESGRLKSVDERCGKLGVSTHNRRHTAGGSSSACRRAGVRRAKKPTQSAH